jgi:hypothetical protein
MSSLKAPSDFTRRGGRSAKVWADRNVRISHDGFACGIGSDIFGLLWTTTMQREIPEEAMSRVSAHDIFGMAGVRSSWAPRSDPRSPAIARGPQAHRPDPGVRRLATSNRDQLTTAGRFRA